MKTMPNFKDLNIDPYFIERLQERNILKASEVQASVIPAILSGQNLVFRSATGTGKTFAYLLPLFTTMLASLKTQGSARPSAWPKILILAPSFELAAQIRAEADFLLPLSGEGKKQTVLLTAEANIARQMERLKKLRPLVVVGAAGRLIQLNRMGKLSFKNLQTLVLDEADKLCEKEQFALNRDLIALLPQARQSIACSATMNNESRKKLGQLLQEDIPFKDLKDAHILQQNIEHWAFYAEDRQKIGLIRSFWHALKPKRLLIFTNLNAQVGNIVAQLNFHGLACSGLFGKMDKTDKQAARASFRSGKRPILVTSDLAARGLDIPELDYIIQLDVPETGEAYAHRAGRTGRAGKKGIIATFGDERSLPLLAAIEKELGLTIYPKELYQGKVQAPIIDDIVE